MNYTKKVYIYQKVSYLLMLGVIHSSLTPLFYSSFSQEAMWFFGTGLSLVFLGFLNIATSRLLEPWLLTITLFANIIGTLFSIMILFTGLIEVQAFIALSFHLIILFFCFTVRKTNIEKEKTTKGDIL